jgi:hypothetical protein
MRGTHRLALTLALTSAEVDVLGVRPRFENASPTVLRNVIFHNRARREGSGIYLNTSNAVVSSRGRGRGRGSCDFSGGVASIHYNLFYRNRKAALLTNGQDFRGIGRADRAIGPPRLLDNVDGNPRFALRHPPRLDSRKFERTTIAEFAAGLRPRLDGRRMPAVDAGDPDPSRDDLDGSRNDIGFTGGPNAPTW